MATGKTTIWKHFRHHAATATAWFLVLLAAGVAGLLVPRPAGWWEDSTSIQYVWGQLQVDGTLFRVRLITDGGTLSVTWGQPITVPFSCVRELGLTFSPVDYLEARFLRRAARSGVGAGPFRYSRLQYGRPAEEAAYWGEYVATVPHWFILLLLLPWPAKRGMGYLKLRRRQRLGLCPNCGYDLRESPERCPECGTARASEIRNPTLE